MITGSMALAAKLEELESRIGALEAAVHGMTAEDLVAIDVMQPMPEIMSAIGKARRLRAKGETREPEAASEAKEAPE